MITIFVFVSMRINMIFRIHDALTMYNKIIQFCHAPNTYSNSSGECRNTHRENTGRTEVANRNVHTAQCVLNVELLSRKTKNSMTIYPHIYIYHIGRYTKISFASCFHSSMKRSQWAIKNSFQCAEK